jgi:eukaryotic-like serine/threonine-protein kinase
MQPENIGGRYRVLRAIGQGGMGTVWLCRDEKLAREVAVKQVGLMPGHSDTDTARAMREARSTAALSHRNVVTVFDVIEEDGHIWLVMEHVPSRTLSRLIRDEGPLSPRRTAWIGAQIADGLIAAHRAGITHRDVKPGNIFVGDGLAKVGDFGISRADGDPTLTGSDLVTGTPTYFSPELATGGDPSAASDVWALGATLYYAVEGRPPYEQRDNPVAVLHDIAQQAPPRPRRAGALEPVLTRMLDRDPATRWSMDDVAHALHRIGDDRHERTTTLTDDLPATMAGSGAEAPPPGPDRDGEPGRKRRSPVGPVLLGVLALAAAVVAVLLLGPGGSDQDGEQDAAGGSATRQPSPSEEDQGADQGQQQPPADESPTPDRTDEQAPASDPATFVDGYYDTVPEDLDAGWAMLSPDYQAEVGRDSYDGFWSTIESVDARDLRTVAGGDAVEATVVFVNGDGETLTERHRVAVVDEGGGPLIAGDETI